MRVLVCTSELAGVTAYTGGVGRRYAALAPAMAELGADVDVLLTPDSNIVCGEAELRRQKVHVRDVSRVPYALRSGPRAIAVTRFTKDRDYDVVFAPEWQGLAAHVVAAPLVTNLVTGIRLINKIQSEATVRSSRLRDALRDRLQAGLEAKQLNRSVRIIAVSQAVLTATRELVEFDTGRAMVVPNCIDVANTARLARAGDLPKGWPTDDGPIILIAGRVEVRKGAVTAARAFALLADRFPGSSLVFAGQSVLRGSRSTAELVLSAIPNHLTSRVHFLGNLGPSQLFAAMAAADVVAAPSHWEAFGNIALEVMACETPLVVTTGSGFDEACHDQVAIRVRPEDPDDLARGLACVLGLDGVRRAELVERARWHVDAFSASSIAPRLLATLDV